MTLGRLVRRSLLHYRQTNLLVLVGLVIAGAVITGSLVIGASMRGSLRDLASGRLGHISYSLTAPRLFSLGLAGKVQRGAPGPVAAVLQTTGVAANAESEATVPGVTIWGVGPDFAPLYPHSPALPPGDSALLNASLARDLQVRVGDTVLLTVNRPAQLGADSIFGHRRLEQVMATLRVPVVGILPDGGAGDLRLDAQSARPRNVFVQRAWLAERLEQPGKASVLLAAVPPHGLRSATPIFTPQGPREATPELVLDQALARTADLADYGLQVKTSAAGVRVYSDALTLTASQVQAVTEAAGALGATTRRSLVYLATALRSVADPRRRASYAVIAGLDPAASYPFTFTARPTRPTIGSDDIWVNDWLAADLGARVGEQVDLDYLVPAPDGTYPTRTKRLRIAGIVATRGPGADPGFMPEYKGLTDAAEMGEWQPPFPVELSRITPRDEEYWKRFRAAPKAFLNVNVVRGMWRAASPYTLPETPATCVEVVAPVRPSPVQAPAGFAAAFTRELTARLRPEDAGLRFVPLRQTALAGARGTSDFSGLFLGLSMFIVMAGAGLAGMLLRLSLQRRAAQVGLMLAAGLPPALVRRALLAEGLLLSAAGALGGAAVGVGYAGVLLRVLMHWWRGALGDTPLLWLHLDAATLATGFLSAFMVGVLTNVLALRGLLRRPVLELLAGWQGLRAGFPAPSRLVAFSLLACLLVTVGLIAAAVLGLLSSVVGFFLVGFLLLVAALLALRLRFAATARQPALRHGLRSLAWRNAAANAARSLLVFGLLAGASFIIVAVAANTRDLSRLDTLRPDSGAGGFNLLATSTVPLPYDPATPEGRANLAIPADDEALLARCRMVSLLASPGEDISCLNLSRPTAPRLLALPPALATDIWNRRRFRPHLSASSDALFDVPTVDCLGDADSVMWTLHSGLDRLYTARDARGRELTFRIAGLLPGSIFARELLIYEDEFRSLYPDITLPSYFLITAPRGEEQAVAEALRRDLGDLGLQVKPTAELLAEFGRVQNTYLSMFLALGGLGLLLGTFGMIIVVARSVMERRRELALLSATGFDRPKIARLLLLEHAGLLLGGLLAGAVAALVAVFPELLQAQAAVNWPALLAVLGAVALVGFGSCRAALQFALRGPLRDSLRQE